MVLIYDHTGKLYSEIHLAPRELPAADLHQCCCLQLQVGVAATYDHIIHHLFHGQIAGCIRSLLLGSSISTPPSCPSSGCMAVLLVTHICVYMHQFATSHTTQQRSHTDLLLILVLQWDATGETLAVLPAGCSFVYTWTAATKELQKLDTDFKASKRCNACW